jgi:hypothetical protein
MTDQHRATPEQWAEQEMWAFPPNGDPYALCLLELRARLEALEAAQRPSQAPAPAKSGSLVDKVGEALDPDQQLSADDVEALARAAIREVAAWLESLPPSFLSQEELKEAAFLIHKEADR